LGNTDTITGLYFGMFHIGTNKKDWKSPAMIFVFFSSFKVISHPLHYSFSDRKSATKKDDKLTSENLHLKINV